MQIQQSYLALLVFKGSTFNILKRHVYPVYHLHRRWKHELNPNPDPRAVTIVIARKVKYCYIKD